MRRWVNALPESKKYVELITAVLTVPVLVTVIYTNWNNIQGKKNAPISEVKAEQPSVIIKEVKQTVTQSVSPTMTATPEPTSATVSPTKQAECKPEIGPINISYPAEGQTVLENPLHVIIEYSDKEYCAVVWSYKINDSSWSSYDDTSFSLFDLPSGEKTIELRVKSIASGEEKLIKRNFTYENKTPPTVTVTPTSSSTSITPTP